MGNCSCSQITRIWVDVLYVNLCFTHIVRNTILSIYPTSEASVNFRINTFTAFLRKFINVMCLYSGLNSDFLARYLYTTPLTCPELNFNFKNIFDPQSDSLVCFIIIDFPSLLWTIHKYR